jgi:hypothetical protein
MVARATVGIKLRMTEGGPGSTVLDLVTLPLGPVVAEAFQTVHEGVFASTTPVEVPALFGFFDWDKAKQLRKRLIEAFLGSSWRPCSPISLCSPARARSAASAARSPVNKAVRMP